MKLVYKNVDKDGQGTVGLIPEEPEDMWHAYNLISEGDSVRSSTIRKVQSESSTGSSTSSRVRTTLTISVENIDFDTQACVLRLKGRNIEENQYVKMGAYHTLDLELNRKFSLRKQEWDSVSLERIDVACDPSKSADVAAVIMQEGLAFVCLITSSMTLVRAKIDVTIPRKRKGFIQQHEKGLQKFYDNVMQAIIRHIDFDIVKCIIIASPGFVKDQFFEYMIQTAIKTDNKLLLENKSKFVLAHSSSGFKHALKEVLQDPAVTSKMADTKAASEVKALEQFYNTLQTEPAKAFYGKKHVEKACEAQAIETLLISDNLFRYFYY
ncbi:protein pelota isoform X2 [Agrilus planipennis]|uniref:Protein pelota isoform X2 n=1 Tax=Agrilus planipennis TaxID=224129 RepID=A0A1W4XSN2_AGRPL|nr:protein pelota isoform X2 [Agrilus planipennis]